RRSCSMSLRYCGEIGPPPSSFFTSAASSFWLRPLALRAFAIAWPKVVDWADICDHLLESAQKYACSRISELIPSCAEGFNREIEGTIAVRPTLGDEACLNRQAKQRCETRSHARSKRTKRSSLSYVPRFAPWFPRRDGFRRGRQPRSRWLQPTAATISYASIRFLFSSCAW